MHCSFPRISSKLSGEWSTSTKMWKSSCEPTSKQQGTMLVSLCGLTLCFPPVVRIKQYDSLFRRFYFSLLNSCWLFLTWMVEETKNSSRCDIYVTARDLTLHCRLWVLNVWSWFACLFQVGDHGADGRVTGDIVWAALPLGSEWVQYTQLILWAHWGRDLDLYCLRPQKWTWSHLFCCEFKPWRKRMRNDSVLFCQKRIMLLDNLSLYFICFVF